MHILQPKHSKMKSEEAKKLLSDLNISISQLPKIKVEDPAILDLKVQVGDMIKIERKEQEKTVTYYRAVV